MLANVGMFLMDGAQILTGDNIFSGLNLSSVADGVKNAIEAAAPVGVTILAMTYGIKFVPRVIRRIGGR